MYISMAELKPKRAVRFALSTKPEATLDPTTGFQQASWWPWCRVPGRLWGQSWQRCEGRQTGVVVTASAVTFADRPTQSTYEFPSQKSLTASEEFGLGGRR